MKLDKDTLVKQRFWFLLIPAALLTLVAVVLLMFVIPAGIRKQRAEVAKKLEEIKGQKDPKNAELVAHEKARADAKKALQTGVWEDAWRCFAVSWLGGPSPAEKVLGIPANTLRQWINDREAR